MYNQGTGLPVPADQVLTQNFVQQLPGWPQTPMTNGLPPQEVEAVHAALINTIQQTANKSPVRTFMFNLLSQHAFNNQTYGDLLDATLEYYMVLRQMGNQGNPLDKAVSETLMAEMPLVVERYQGLLGFLSQQQQQELWNLNALRNQISTLVHQAQGGGYGQPNGYGVSQPPGGYPQQMGGYGYPQQGPAPSVYQPPGARPMPGPGPMGHPGGGRPGAFHGNMNQNRPVVSPQGGQTRSASGMLDTSGQNAGMSTGAQSASRKPVVGAAAVNTSKIFNKEEDMKRVDPVDRELGHLSAVHAAKESEAHGKYAPAIDRPVEFVAKRYVPARKLDQQIVRAEVDGELTFSIINLEQGENMNYEDHEHNQNMVKLSRRNQVGPKVGVPTDWAKVNKPNEIDETDEQVELEYDEPVALTETIDAYTLDQARVEAFRKLEAKGVSDNSERVVECYVNLRTPILSNREEYKQLLEKLEGVTGLTELVDAVVELKDVLSNTLWYEIHDRMTCVFNRRLKAGLGLPDWNVDSITTDYAEAIEALAEEFRHVAIDRFKSNTYMCMRKALMVVFSEKTNILHLIDDASITALPWSSDQIDLVLESEYAMLTASVNAHFHSAATKLFQRTNVKDRSVNRRYFVTADNVWIEIHVGDLSGETLLISKVNRC